MKVRLQAKRRLTFLVKNAKLNRWFQRMVDQALQLTPEEIEEQQRLSQVRWNDLWADIQRKQAIRQLVEEPAEPLQAPKKYTVAKRSTGEVVAVYDDLGDAEEHILKAARQKKATLVLAD